MKHHIPILVKEIISFLPDQPNHIVDGTFGHGGHTIAFLDYLHDHNENTLVQCFDRDSQVLSHGKAYVEEFLVARKRSPNIHYIHDNFAHIYRYIEHPQCVDFIFLDLGINREHVTDDSRGFSFQGEGPLDMRFNQHTGQTAFEYIGSSPRENIKNRFIQYGDFSEKRAELLAQCIFSHKSDSKLRTTEGFVTLLRTVGVRKHELAPIFQSIRIATNQEFDHIISFFTTLDTLLALGGRCAILSFHSIEDRLIKNQFKALANTGGYTILTKHVISPSRSEVQSNKASRSAKLRVIEKTSSPLPPY